MFVNGYNVISLIYNVESEDMISSFYKVSHWSNCTQLDFMTRKEHGNAHTDSSGCLHLWLVGNQGVIISNCHA